jgi:hypothetical protein
VQHKDWLVEGMKRMTKPYAQSCLYKVRAALMCVLDGADKHDPRMPQIPDLVMKFKCAPPPRIVFVF